MILRRKYLTRANHQKIMAEIEQKNNTYKENLDQVQGKMDMILELLRTQKDNTPTATETEATAEHVLNQPGSLPGPSRNSIVHPWGCHITLLHRLSMMDLSFLIIQGLSLRLMEILSLILREFLLIFLH